jgi:hypothetical protein
VRPVRRRSEVLTPSGASVVTSSDEVMSSFFRKGFVVRIIDHQGIV